MLHDLFSHLTLGGGSRVLQREQRRQRGGWHHWVIKEIFKNTESRRLSPPALEVAEQLYGEKRTHSLEVSREASLDPQSPVLNPFSTY